MTTSGGTELGYASVAILTALLKQLVGTNIITPQTSSDILDEAVTSLKGFGTLVFVPGAIGVISEIRADLAKTGLI